MGPLTQVLKGFRDGSDYFLGELIVDVFPKPPAPKATARNPKPIP